VKLRFIYGNKARVLNTNKILLAFVVFLFVLVPFTKSAGDPFSITEIKTEYGIAENTITLEIKDLIDKDQYITNISEIFADHPLTDEIVIQEVLLNRSYQADVYGYLNESQGKYKTIETIEECTGNETNETLVCENVTYYYDNNETLMDCDYVLGDKTCIKTVFGVVGTEVKSDFLNLPTNKEKIVINGLKIEQKQSGLSIPIPKGSTVQIKIRYSHPLAYGLKVPNEINKYNVSMTTADGSVILDPYWDVNSSYTVRYLINCTNLDDNTPIVINGSDGFEIDGKKQIVWTYCSGTGTALYLHNSTDYSDYVVANDTTQIPFEVEFGNGTSYNPTDVWDANYEAVYHMYDITTTTINDSALSNHGTKVGVNQPIESNGLMGNAQTFSNDYYIEDGNSIGDGNSYLTAEVWIKRDAEDVLQFLLGRSDFGGNQNTNSFGFYMGSDNKLSATITTVDNTGITAFAGTITDSNWHYCVVTYNNSKIVSILDTVSGTPVSQTGVLTDPTSSFRIGRATRANLGFSGVIDEVRVSNIVRSASFLNQTYQNAIGTSGYGNALAMESAPSGEAPSIISNTTKPDIVYTNTDWKLNITATDPENASFTAYTQFYVNGESSGGEASHSINNDTNTNVANLSSSSFNAGDKLIAEMWVGDNIDNSSKTNSSEVTVSYFVMGGTVKDSSNIVVNNAKVIIIDQSDNTITGTTDSNSTGGWTYNIGSTGTYLVVAYDPNNSTRDGDADPHIVVS